MFTRSFLLFRRPFSNKNNYISPSCNKNNYIPPSCNKYDMIISDLNKIKTMQHINYCLLLINVLISAIF